jgi:hypothetical protein
MPGLGEFYWEPEKPMLPIPTIWRPIAFGSLAASLALALFAGLCWHKWGVWKEKAEEWARQADTVVIALQTASGNPKAAWDTAASQILALGDDKRQWQATSERQSRAVQDMLDSTRALKARSDELKRIASEAQAKRAAAIRKLQDMATSPSERADCEVLLKEANDALDEVYRQGL